MLSLFLTFVLNCAFFLFFFCLFLLISPPYVQSGNDKTNTLILPVWSERRRKTALESALLQDSNKNENKLIYGIINKLFVAELCMQAGETKVGHQRRGSSQMFEKSTLGIFILWKGHILLLARNIR